MSAHLRLLDNDPAEFRRVLFDALDALDYRVTGARADALWQQVDEQMAAFALTRREREITHLLIRGWLDKEIATELGISKKTATNWTRSILAKVGARRRGEILPVLLGMLSPGSHACALNLKVSENPRSGRPNPPS